jgi:serine/threonine-protein kinase
MNESLAAGHAAADLDPASVSIRRSLGWLYYHAGRYDTALQHLQRAQAMDPTAAENHRILAIVYAAQGNLAAAEAAGREAVRLSSDGAVSVGLMAMITARAGRTGEARALLAGLLERAAREYVSPVALGTAYLGLGELDAALGELERAYRERRGWVVYLDVEYLFAPLRGHPRFEELRRRLAL